MSSEDRTDNIVYTVVAAAPALAFDCLFTGPILAEVLMSLFAAILIGAWWLREGQQ